MGRAVALTRRVFGTIPYQKTRGKYPNEKSDMPEIVMKFLRRYLSHTFEHCSNFWQKMLTKFDLLVPGYA